MPVLSDVGWGIRHIKKQEVVSRSRVTEIANLDLLRKEGVVTEEEFLQGESTDSP